MSYIRLLSRRQVIWAVGGLFAMAVLVTAGLLTESGDEAPSEDAFRTDMSLRQVAMNLGSTGKAVARELGLPLSAPKGKPLASLGITKERLHQTVHHLVGHRDSNLKYWLYAALMVWGWIFLARIGRIPGGIRKRDRLVWYPRSIYTVALLLSVAITGFVLGKSPNPMEGAVKVFKSMVGLYPDVLAKVLAFLFFLGLAIVANKLICGWGCPFGALQELLHSIPWLKKAKRRAKPPFMIMNLIRGVLFVVVLLVLFGAVGGSRGLVIYHYVNPFNLFNLDFESSSVIITIAAALLLGLLVYRPFCQVICPFGFLSWLVERVSLFRVRIDHESCDTCGACAKACPSSAAEGLVKQDPFRADCFSCGECLNVCHTDAIRYESVLSRRSESAQSATPDRGAA